jgi:hypothetical protein
MHALAKAVVLVLLGVAVMLAAATGLQRSAADPDLLGLVAIGAVARRATGVLVLLGGLYLIHSA